MNKNMKIVISIILILIILWGVIFFIDFFRCVNFKMPIFVISDETADDGGSGIYYGLGYKVIVEKNISAEYGVLLEKIEMYIGNKFITGAIAQLNPHFSGEENAVNTSNTTKIEELPEDYSLKQAAEDECVICIHRRKMYNKDKLDTFLENVENNKSDFIRCINYTIEGDMIIIDVKFEGGNTFSVCKDLTRDKYSSQADRTYKYGKFSKIVIDETEEGTNIYLKDEIEGELQGVIIVSYDKNVEIINDYESGE